MDDIIDLLIDQQYQTKNGPVYLSECEIVYYDIDFALTRLLDLHLRATKQVPIINTEEHFGNKSARDLFSVSVCTMNASLLTFTDSEIEYFLNKLLDICYKAQSIEGFESVFFTALNSYSGNNQFLKDYYFQKFTTFGELTNLGGGFNNSYFIDKTEEAFIGFNNNINEIIIKSKMTKQSYSNFRERILAERATKMDCVTGAVIVGAYGAIRGTGLLGKTIGGLVGAGIGCYIGYKTEQKLNEIREKSNELDKIWKENDPDYVGKDKDKKGTKKNEGEVTVTEGDDSNDEFPEKPESTDNPDGCIINPLWSDYKRDPYSAFSKATKKSVLAIGRGFRAYIYRTENNIYTISKMPTIEFSKSGLANISKLGFLNEFPNFKIELEKKQLSYLKSLKSIEIKPKNKTGLFSDLTNIPLIDEIKETDPGYGINTETYTHTTIDAMGNEIVTTEQVNTIIFTNPALIALYGNSISVSISQLDTMLKFLKLISNSDHIGAIDIPKNAGEQKINKYK